MNGKAVLIAFSYLALAISKEACQPGGQCEVDGTVNLLQSGHEMKKIAKHEPMSGNTNTANTGGSTNTANTGANNAFGGATTNTAGGNGLENLIQLGIKMKGSGPKGNGVLDLKVMALKEVMATMDLCDEDEECDDEGTERDCYPDGLLSPSELGNCLPDGLFESSLLGAMGLSYTVDEVVDQADVDDDGSLSGKELEQWMMTILHFGPNTANWPN